MFASKLGLLVARRVQHAHIFKSILILVTQAETVLKRAWFMGPAVAPAFSSSSRSSGWACSSTPSMAGAQGMKGSPNKLSLQHLKHSEAQRSTAKHSEAHGIAWAVGRDQGQGSSATFVAERCILDSGVAQNRGANGPEKLSLESLYSILHSWGDDFQPHMMSTWWAWSTACLPCGIARYAEKSSSVGSVRRQSESWHLSVNGWNISTFLWKNPHLYSEKSSTMNGYEWIGMVDVTSLYYVSSKRYWQMHKLHGMSWNGHPELSIPSNLYPGAVSGSSAAETKVLCATYSGLSNSKIRPTPWERPHRDQRIGAWTNALRPWGLRHDACWWWPPILGHQIMGKVLINQGSWVPNFETHMLERGSLRWHVKKECMLKTQEIRCQLIESLSQGINWLVDWRIGWLIEWFIC